MNNEVNNNNQFETDSMDNINKNNYDTNTIPNNNGINTSEINHINNQTTNNLNSTVNNTAFNSNQETESNTIKNNEQAQFQNNIQSINDINGFNTNNQKPKINKKIIVIICSLLMLSALGILSFKLISDYNNPKIRLAISMKKYLKKANIEKETKQIYKMFNNGFTLGLDGGIKAKYKEEEKLNLTYNMKIIDNPKDSKQYYNLKLNDSKEEIINLEGLIQNNKFYLTIKEELENYYFTDANYVKLYDKKSEKLIENVKTSISEYLTKDKFNNSDSSINIDGKQIKVNKISLNITKKMLDEIMIKVLENLKKDDEALKFLVSKDTSINDVKESIDETLKSLNESLSDINEEKPIIYTAYVKSFNILKQELIIGDYNFIMNGETKGNISITSNNKVILKGTYDQNNVKLSIVEDETTIEININSEKKYEKNKINEKYKLDTSIKTDGEPIFLNATLNLKMNKDNTTPKIDVSSAKNINNITSDDQNVLIEKIMSFPLISDYYKKFENNMKTNNYEIEFNNCDYAFNCIENSEGKFSCNYYNANYELDNVICNSNSGYTY